MAEHADAVDIAEIIRNEWPGVVAALVAGFGDLGAAEDAAQDAVEEALQTWPNSGLPDAPRAWLIVVARRRLIDRLRRNSVGQEKSELVARSTPRHTQSADDELENLHEMSLMRDEQLRLIFGCCHPALNPKAQVALTLRSVGGLSTQEIARAFLVPEPTIAQRLVRAKKKIRAAGIPFKIPPDTELLARTDMVRSVLYLIFNEGYDTSAGSAPLRTDLCEEAIRLSARLAELTPEDPETVALHALFLLIHARRAARFDDHDDLVLLEDQDRTAWDRPMIERGTVLLERALRLGRRGPIQIQAAVHALHDEAPRAADTDWEQIELLYRRLSELSPGPVVTLNHAVAVAMTDGPAAGLVMLDDTDLAERLATYPHFHAARGRLLDEVGHHDDAGYAFDRALQLVRNDAERRFLVARRDASRAR